MGWRTVVVTNTVKLDYKMGYLCVRSKDEVKRIYIDEISILIIETPSVALTSYLLVELANHNVDILFCDQKRCPHGLYHSLYGSHNTSKKIRSQITWKEENKDKIWKEIIIRKILGQSEVLEKNRKQEAALKLREYLPQVKDGDATNREGHAAKVYFNALFGKEFSRERDNEPDITNAELNYGYAVLLSVVAREIIANGYLTQIGIFHDNMFNEFNLASDLMEPLRPFVDQKVTLMKYEEFNTEAKSNLVKFLNAKVLIDQREQYLLKGITIYIKSILDALEKEDSSLIKFPEYDMSIYESDSVL